MIRVLYVEDNDDNVYMLKLRFRIDRRFRNARGGKRRDWL